MAKLKLMIAAVASAALLGGGAFVMTQSGQNTAYAQSASAKATVDGAIARGEVGEQLDGYLGIVDGANPSSDVRNAVQEINIARKAVYVQFASQQGVEISVAAGLTGEKQIRKAASGTMIKGASGRWERK